MPRIRGLLILCLVACGGEKDADTASTDTTRSTTTPSPTQSTADTGTPSTTTSTTPTTTTSPVGTADTSVDPVISSMSFNEVLANPGGYDANCDGVGSTTEDEFIELVNTSAKPVTLDGATLGDLITTHHVFPKGTTLEPGGAVVVFSGGDPSFDQPLPDRGAHCVPLPDTALLQVASSGRLGLINGGETLLLTEAKTLLSATYGGLDLSGESFNRDPDMALKGWTGHRSVMGSSNGFSPGTRVDGSGFDGSPAYTEGDTGTTTPTSTTSTDTAEDTGLFDTGEVVATIDLGAFLVNEIHADAVVDGNCDGVSSFTEDEFIELVFQGSEGLDLAGVRITNESSIRHTFEPLWVEPGDGILIFGGGAAGFGSDDHAWCGDLPDNVHVVFASSGSLALGDRGDSISLVDVTGTLSVDTSWDDSLPSDQSAVRSPELSDSAFVGHLSVSDAPVSPGTQSHGARLDEPAPPLDTGLEDTSTADTGLEDTSSEDTGPVDTAPPAPAYDTATVATYSLVINEILADPDLETGDANCDGEADAYDDEFVEIVNRGDITADLTGSTLSDTYGVRHTIGPVVLSPNEALVIFGGGAPKLDGGSSSEDSHCTDVTLWASIETSSTGGLGLTNTEDELTLTHPSGLVLASAVYGAEAGMNQSIVRVPELSDASWVGHSSVVEAPFSPGTRVNGTAFFAAPALDTGLPVETADTGEADTAAVDTGSAEPMSDIVLNELLATTELDVNCDGFVIETEEIFLEWVNRSDEFVSIFNWEIWVDGVSKHVFTGLTLNPGDAVIVFGGGVPLFDGSAPSSHCSPLPGSVTTITASTGGLDLSPSGSSVMLVNRTGVEMHSYTYGDEGSGETSLVRDPELSDEPMVPHTDLDPRSSFSPGTRAGGGVF